jgi:hypothetical protein
MNEFWEEDNRRLLPRVIVSGHEVVAGSRVKLDPRPGRDIFDIALAGKVAIVEAIEQDLEDNVFLAVTIEEDPGRDLGHARQIAHRFFFSVDEVTVVPGGSNHHEVLRAPEDDEEG